METLGRFKFFLGVHRNDIGMFILRIAITYALVAHSANILSGILPDGLKATSEIIYFLLSSIELLCGIMILSGFLISIASYIVIIILTYLSFFDKAYLGLLVQGNNESLLILFFGAVIAVSLIGPGKFVLNKRYGHIASTLRETGVDKEAEVMGT